MLSSCRTKELDTAYELDPLSAANRPSTRRHFYLFTEWRVETRIITSHGQPCKSSYQMICFLLIVLTGSCDRRDPGIRYRRFRVTLLFMGEK
jgi:hypothetical protein